MRGLFIFLLLGFISVHIVYAQQPVAGVEKQVANTDTTTTTTTTTGKKTGVATEIKKDINAQKDRIVGQVKAAKRNLQSVKMVTKPAPRQGTTSDTTRKVPEKSKIKDVVKQVSRNAGIGNRTEVKSHLKSEHTVLKNEVGQQVSALKKDVPDTADARSFSKQIHRQMLEEKMSQVQYSSDDPKNARWNKNVFSKDDLGFIKIPSAPQRFLPSVEDGLQNKTGRLKNSNVTDPSKALGSGIITNVGNALKPEKLAHLQDSLADVSKQLKNTLDLDAQKQKLRNAKKIYSDKYIRKIYDSLGVKKADSLFKVASAFARTETSKEELLNRINSSISGKKPADAAFDASGQGISMEAAKKMQDIDKDLVLTDLDELKKVDLSRFALPQSVLSELPPLSGTELDAKYLHVVDSMRQITLRAKGYVMEDKKVAEDVKRSLLKRKPSLLGKIYFDGIIGLYKDTAVNVVKLSPSVGYHFSTYLSVGLGTNFLLQVKDKKLNMQAGLRPFMKAEIWKQRGYLQVEDNIKTSKADKELVKNDLIHEVLGGGGIVLPLSGSLGINLQLLYRLNTLATNPGQSPWVFRVGLSSIKKIK